MEEHLRRRDVRCAAALLQEPTAAVAWSVADGAEVDAGQTLGTAGLIERGNLLQLVAPCRGKLRLRPLDDVQRDAQAALASAASADSSDANTDANESAGQEADAAATVVVASVEYCIHPLKNGRTCMMCLAVVDESEEDMDGERRSVSVISHGQVLRLNIEEASRWRS